MMLRPLLRPCSPFVAALLFASGCAYSIQPSNPRPNLALAPQPSSLKLALGPTVADAFEIPAKADLRRATVEGWHGTLTNGFSNGFQTAYRVAPSVDPSDFVLLLEEASPELVTVSIGYTLAVTVHIRYRAALIDTSGAQRVAAGTAVSKKATTTPDAGVNGIVVSAVEAMYEEIAAKLFAHATSAAPSSPTHYAPPSETEGLI